MPSATLTSKGQITIPKKVREALGLETGDSVAFRIGEDGTVTLHPETVSIASLFGMLSPRRRGLELEDMEDGP